MTGKNRGESKVGCIDLLLIDIPEIKVNSLTEFAYEHPGAEPLEAMPAHKLVGIAPYKDAIGLIPERLQH